MALAVFDDGDACVRRFNFSGVEMHSLAYELAKVVNSADRVVQHETTIDGLRLVFTSASADTIHFTVWTTSSRASYLGWLIISRDSARDVLSLLNSAIDEEYQ